MTDEQIRDAEAEIASQKRQREYAKWDAELVGRYFRVIRTPQKQESYLSVLLNGPQPLSGDDYVTLEETLGVGGRDKFGHPANYVYADVVYIHIRSRADSELTCSGFEVSHADRKEPYLKIQPVFYSYSDFRNYLGSWSQRTGPTKHFDEITKEDYKAALVRAVKSFVPDRCE